MFYPDLMFKILTPTWKTGWGNRRLRLKHRPCNTVRIDVTCSNHGDVRRPQFRAAGPVSPVNPIKMKRFRLPLLLLTLIAVAGCGKDPVLTKADLLAKAWKYKSFSASAGALTVDVLSQMRPCELDDIYRFKSDKTFAVEEGLTKCAPTDPQIKESGPWRFNAAETKLYLGTDSVEVIELTSTSLHLRFNEPGPPAALIDVKYVPAQ